MTSFCWPAVFLEAGRLFDCFILLDFVAAGDDFFCPSRLMGVMPDECHKGFGRTLAALVDGLGKYFFARTCFSQDQHGGVSRRNTLYLGQNKFQSGTAPHYVVESAISVVSFTRRKSCEIAH